MKTEKQYRKINEAKFFSLENLMKLTKNIARITEEKREDTNTNIRNEAGDSTTDPVDIKGIII